MRKWYSLYDKVYRWENLLLAYQKVKSNKGGAEIDGITISDFDKEKEKELRHLEKELQMKTYRPQSVKQVYIPKPDGSERPLGIPTVRDRVVQQCLLNILQPIFDPDFHPSSYGYRPGGSAAQAVAKAERFSNRWGLRYVVDMDLSKCFDTLDHDLIIAGVREKVSDGKRVITHPLNAYNRYNGQGELRRHEGRQPRRRRNLTIIDEHLSGQI